VYHKRPQGTGGCPISFHFFVTRALGKEPKTTLEHKNREKEETVRTYPGDTVHEIQIFHVEISNNIIPVGHLHNPHDYILT
jgi:hypothetical protein